MKISPRCYFEEIKTIWPPAQINSGTLLSHFDRVRDRERRTDHRSIYINT